GPVVDAAVHYDKQRIWGYVETNPVYVQKYQPGASIKMYFFAELNKAPKSFGAFRDSLTFSQRKDIQGAGSGMYLQFDTKAGEPIEIKTGLSYTSVDHARLNLQQEAGKLSFDLAKSQALDTWNKAL